jgi:hypothetical protein
MVQLSLMKVVQVSTYVYKAKYSWWDKILMVWPLGYFIRLWKTRQFTNNLTKAFQQAVREAKKLHEN